MEARVDEFDKVYTHDEFVRMNLKEGVHAELIDGNIYYFASPDFRHQHIVHILTSIIGDYLETTNPNCEVFFAPLMVKLFEKEDEDERRDKNTVEPDIFVACDMSKFRDGGYYGAPEFIIEVTGNNTFCYDKIKKMNKYREAGVKEYWVVQYELEAITVFDFMTSDLSKNVVDYEDGNVITSSVFPNLTVDVGELFKRVRDRFNL